MPTATPTAPTKGALTKWTEVKKHIRSGEVLRVCHPESGIELSVGITAIGNHFDFVPYTKEDTAKLKEIYDGKWSWTRKPMLVLIDGEWIAASANGMPHGDYDKVDNGIVGVMCMHFLGSRTSESNVVDAEHQRCVRAAAGIDD